MNKKEQPEPTDAIPQFASREEEAEFWDTHSLADHWEEFAPAQVRFAEDLSGAIVVPLDSESLEALRTLAKKDGVEPPVLAKAWILERLGQDPN